MANKFGGEGFQVALVARSADKLEKARDAFQARGIKAAAFPADLSDPNAAKGLVKRVTDQLGPITAIHWNAYANTAGDVMAADAAALRTGFDVSVTSLVLTVQAALVDLKAARERYWSRTVVWACSIRRSTRWPFNGIRWVWRSRTPRSTSSSACLATRRAIADKSWGIWP